MDFFIPPPPPPPDPSDAWKNEQKIEDTSPPPSLGKIVPIDPAFKAQWEAGMLLQQRFEEVGFEVSMVKDHEMFFALLNKYPLCIRRRKRKDGTYYISGHKFLQPRKKSYPPNLDV